MNEVLAMTKQLIALNRVKVTDPFWAREMELVRREMIPWQWEALHDRIEGAAPSYCIHNFRAAARLQEARRNGKDFRFVPWKGTFETLPEKGEKPDENGFYGFLFQDSDLYKWLEAVSYSLMTCPDEALEKQAEDMVRLIADAQDEDGYLDTFYQLKDRRGAFENLAYNHELYCLGHLTEAAAAWHMATGRDDLIRVADRFIQCVIRNLSGKGAYPGHEIAEMALFRLYEETGSSVYRDLAMEFLDGRGRTPNYFLAEENRRRKAESRELLEETEAERFHYQQAHMPVRSQREAVGHAVRAMYLYAGMTDAVRLTGDREMEEALQALWHSVVREKMYITGGVGGTVVGEAFSRPFDLKNDEAYAETCASVGLVFWARRMLQIHPRAEYADVMERALYNGVLSGVALDGKSFFYVNPLSVEPEAADRDKRIEHVKKERQKWFGCACCPPNLARLVASLPMYAITCSEKRVNVHLYLSQEAEVSMGDETLVLAVRADFMRSGHAEVEILRGSAEGSLALRLPGWCASPRVETDRVWHNEEGYAVLEGSWKAGDTVRLDFPMTCGFFRADPRVEADQGKVAVQYGPFVMCAEEADNGTELKNLRVCPESAEPVCERAEIGGLNLPGVRLSAFRAKEPAGVDALYWAYQKEEKEACEIHLVPYFAWDNRGSGEMRVWLQLA